VNVSSEKAEVCSFCDKTHKDVLFIVARTGSAVSICDECVAQCQRIMVARSSSKGRQP
jgi:ATP-dependent protease Clp ATPase subunit